MSKPTIILATAATLILSCAPQVSATPQIVARARSSDEPVGGFVPTLTPAVIALALFFLSGTIHFIHLYRMGRKFMLVLPIAMYCMCLGFVLRIVFSHNATSVGIYAIMDLFILLSPCAFLATNYVLLKQLALAMGESIADDCLFLKSTLVVRIFVISDIITFLLQGAGGGIMASAKSNSGQNLGKWVSLIGLILQLISYLLFVLLMVVFGLRIRSRFPATWGDRSTRTRSMFSGISLFSKAPIDDWRLLFWTMCLSSVGIVVRCAFRVGEFTGGYSGYLMEHEGYFYCLDSIPLFLAMSLYCFVWPPRLIQQRSTGSYPQEEMYPKDSTTEMGMGGKISR